MQVHFAKWIFPVSHAPIEDGAIVTDEYKIVFVGRRKMAPSVPDANVTDHGQAMIVPGLINSHTHLEFSDLTQPLGHPGIEFTDWIRAVVKHRLSCQSDKSSAIESGLNESLNVGVAAIGEIATAPVSIEDYQLSNDHPLETIIFHEQLGSDESTYNQKTEEIHQLLMQSKNSLDCLTAAISPHAPYSTPPKLLDRLVDVAVEQGCPVAMHVAETPAERIFVDRRGGPFRDMLEEFGVWRPEMYPSGDSLLSILKKLAQAQRALIVHGNYLQGAELDFLQSQKNSMHVVYCPRTHAFFQHTEYPLCEMIERGINVAVGTDSRASNPDLDVWEELKWIHRSLPDLKFDQLLKLGTINGAIALGVDDALGTLEVGKRAAMKVIPTSVDDPLSSLK